MVDYRTVIVSVSNLISLSLSGDGLQVKIMLITVCCGFEYGPELLGRRLGGENASKTGRLRAKESGARFGTEVASM